MTLTQPAVRSYLARCMQQGRAGLGPATATLCSGHGVEVIRRPPSTALDCWTVSISSSARTESEIPHPCVPIRPDASTVTNSACTRSLRWSARQRPERDDRSSSAPAILVDLAVGRMGPMHIPLASFACDLHVTRRSSNQGRCIPWSDKRCFSANVMYPLRVLLACSVLTSSGPRRRRSSALGCHATATGGRMGMRMRHVMKRRARLVSSAGSQRSD